MSRTRFKGAVLAPWWKRVVARLIDFLPLILFFLVTSAVNYVMTGSESSAGIGTTLYGVLFLVAIGVTFFDVVIRQGRTGRSMGKQALKLRLVDVDRGRPLGIGKTFGR